MVYPHKKLFDLDDAAIATTVEELLHKSKGFEEEAEAAFRRFNTAFYVTLAAGLAYFLFGSDRAIALTLIMAAGLVKTYGLASAIEWELQKIKNNSAVVIFLLVGALREKRGRDDDDD